MIPETKCLTNVSKLKASCLLLHGNDRIAMHDFVYATGLAIAYRDKPAFALKSGDVFEDWPDRRAILPYLNMSCHFLVNGYIYVHLSPLLT